jgi:choline dehydrogenase-like flavoprotein
VIYVVGSGPSGISAAMALLARGERVTMLDAGIELEPERRQLVGQLAAQDPARWSPDAIARIKEYTSSGKSGIRLKYAYGSDFPYRDADRYLPREGSGVGLVPSLARGGFSNVWGAAVLPYVADEVVDWPVPYDRLAPHYEAVLSFMGLAATKDDLAERFPLFSTDYHPAPTSRQAESLLHDLNAHRDTLRSRGFLFGYSRLAVRARNDDGRGCAACGLCMYGCPYGLIYSTGTTLEALRRNPMFRYEGGVLVERFVETADGVEIRARSMVTGEPQVHTGSRMYVAAGVLSSTRLVLESLSAYDQPVTLLDSQYFLLPLLRYRGEPGAARESLHTLAQVFIELFDREVSEHSVHLQVYTYNDLYPEAVRAVLGPAFPAFRPALHRFLARFLVIQGYLHSDLSARVSMRLRPPRDGAVGTLALTVEDNPATRPALRRVTRKLSRNRSLLRAVPLSPMLRAGEAGRGFHAGGTLPMSASPGPLQTDVWGRPYGLRRVHVVDSSVFPSITASTITLTVMANAHRIAAEDVPA